MWKRRRFLFLSFALLSSCLAGSPSQSREYKAVCSNSKRGLHATLGVQSGWYGDFRLETLTFRLMNDSDQTLESFPGSWTLVIDGREVPDPGGQLWMGGKPSGGYESVPSGTTFEFGKGLPIARYFPKARNYRIYWKAACFRSNVALVGGAGFP